MTAPSKPSPAVNGTALAALLLGASSLALCCSTGLPALYLGNLGLKAARAGRGGRGMALGGLALGLFGTILTAVPILLGVWGTKAVERVKQRHETGEAGERVLKTFTDYERHQKRYPNQIFTAKPGQAEKAILSWRVELLPYLGRDDLFRRFNQMKPWNDPANEPLARARIPSFVATYDGIAENRTRWRSFTGPGTLHDSAVENLNQFNLPDGAANTLAFVESAELVDWPEPNDYPFPFDPKQPVPALGRPGSPVAIAAFLDGSVRVLRKPISLEVLQALATRNGGELVFGEDFPLSGQEFGTFGNLDK